MRVFKLNHASKGPLLIIPNLTETKQKEGWTYSKTIEHGFHTYFHSLQCEDIIVVNCKNEITVARSKERVNFHIWISDEEGTGEILPDENTIFLQDGLASDSLPATRGVVVVDRIPSKISFLSKGYAVRRDLTGRFNYCPRALFTDIN